MTGEQYRYRDPREAVDRANRILINNLPDGVDTIAITQQRDHLPLVTTQTDVASLRKQLAGQPLGRGGAQAAARRACGYHSVRARLPYSRRSLQLQRQTDAGAVAGRSGRFLYVPW